MGIDTELGATGRRPRVRGRRVVIVAVTLAAGVVLTGVALTGAGVLGLGLAGGDAPADGELRCREIAAEAGLVFAGRYGTTVAADDGGVVMQRNMGNGAAVGDIDADGDLDVYLLGQAGERNILFRNDLAADGRARRYVDVTAEAGLEDLGLGRVAHFADIDGDGPLDLVLLNDADPEGRLSPSRLFRNLGGGRFEDVTSGSGFDPVGYLVGGATLVDVDLDGDLDLYVAFWTMELGGTAPGRQPEGKLPGSNRLYRNDGGFRFTDVTDEVGLGGITVDSFSAIFHDWDGDGDLDLYQAVDHREDLFFEQIDGRFVDRSAEAGTLHVGNDMGIAMADVDGSGSLDLFVTNILDPEENFGKKPRGNTLLLAGPRPGGGVAFTDAAYDLGVRDTAWGWGTAFVDLDLDGDQELMAVQGFDEFVSIYSRPLYHATSALFTRTPEGGFRRAPTSGCEVPGDQRALVPFDHDRDGDLDLLITQVGLPVQLLENGAPDGRGITIVLDGPGGRGSGARIDATVAGRTTSQLVLHGGSYLAGTPLEAVVGLGSAAVAERIVVTDVRGASVTLRDVPAGSVLRLDPGGRP